MQFRPILPIFYWDIVYSDEGEKRYLVQLTSTLARTLHLL